MNPSKVSDSAEVSRAEHQSIDAICDQFEAVWRSMSPPVLRDYVYAERANELSPSARKVLFRELLRIDLEYRHDRDERPAEGDYDAQFSEFRELISAELVSSICGRFERDWKRGTVPSIQEFLKQIAAPAQSMALAGLLSLDLEHRSRLHKKLTPEQYVAMLPQYAKDVRQFFSDQELLRDTVSLISTDLPSPRMVSDQGLGIFGDYELLEEIARGGMGVVYKARQVSLGRLVAVKMILAGELATAEQVQRFYGEARAAGSLKHPNIVAVHEVGHVGDRHYYSMDYVEGQSLSQVLRRMQFTPMQTASLVYSIAEAVQFAHDRKVIHRDLKPGNILLDNEQRPHITDFGLAKALDSGSDLTASGVVAGSPAYMSPEQASGRTKDVGPLTDVYSLGAVLYELLTGRPPFQAESVIEVLEQVRQTPPKRPRLLHPTIPTDLEKICLKCLEKLPSDRYTSARELADELQRFLNGDPVLVRPRSRISHGIRWCRRNPAVTLLSSALVGVLFFGGVVSFTALGGWQMMHSGLPQPSSNPIYAPPPAEDLGDISYVRLRLEVTDLEGSVLKSLKPDQEFQLRGYAQDLRTNPQGVFAAYWDVTFPSNRAVVTGAIDHSANYSTGRAGDVSKAGQLDEIGGFTNLVSGFAGGDMLVFTVPMRATSVGQLTFAGNPADEEKMHDILVFGLNRNVPSRNVEYGSLTLDIVMP